MHACAARARLGAGTRRRHCANPRHQTAQYLQENVGALDVDLTAADLARIYEVAPEDAFAGSRYPKAMIDLLNR